MAFPTISLTSRIREGASPLRSKRASSTFLDNSSTLLAASLILTTICRRSFPEVPPSSNWSTTAFRFSRIKERLSSDSERALLFSWTTESMLSVRPARESPALFTWSLASLEKSWKSPAASESFARKEFMLEKVAWTPPRLVLISVMISSRAGGIVPDTTSPSEMFSREAPRSTLTLGSPRSPPVSMIKRLSEGTTTWLLTVTFTRTPSFNNSIPSTFPDSTPETRTGAPVSRPMASGKTMPKEYPYWRKRAPPLTKTRAPRKTMAKKTTRPTLISLLTAF